MGAGLKGNRRDELEKVNQDNSFQEFCFKGKTKWDCSSRENMVNHAISMIFLLLLLFIC